MPDTQKLVSKLNRFQLKYRPLSFVYAVIKKQGEDRAGYQAALLTYYSFLSLFPLLMVITTITNIVIGSDAELEDKIVSGITSYFPMLGDQLSSHVHTLNKSGAALFIGLLFAFYGARGVADAFQHGIQNIWHIPDAKRDGFPKNIYKSLTIIIVGGLGFITAAVCAGLASSAGKGFFFRFLASAINVFLLYWVFKFLLSFSLNKKIKNTDTRLGALVAAIGLVCLQYFGVILLGRELKNLDALYSYFAIALGLMFWLYLQAQMIYLAAQVSVVHSDALWPRSLDNKNPTPIDKAIKKRAGN